ncbi:MAG: secretion-associated protein EspG [Amycolatopsis sp.]|uniref:ESX secretion-associated protein EspG n=1 Tax=Amycolatopsis sp. TaxID=37632 RepID=UPI00261D2853|nr:ESX secretion-associated protein EspG [Amycolatopsis sp.]MCU1680616.1 secretion-associated protein EspG [Amycolatopsis sp.]
MTSVIADAEAPGTVHFGLVELDLLAAHAGVSLPYPLRVPSFGRIAGEREVLLAAAGQTLRLRGFADETGPLGPAAELVAALREHRGTIDLVLAGPGGATGVVAMVYRSWALICRQPLDDDPASTVWIRRVGQTALTDELLSMVPDLIPARSMPIVLPAHAVNTATRLIAEISDDAAKEQCLRDLVRDCGGDPEALGRLAGLLPELTGRGQFGATRRSGGGNVRAGVELSWLDGPRGRVRVNRATDGWVSVNPVRQADLRFALNDMATIVRSN